MDRRLDNAFSSSKTRQRAKLSTDFFSVAVKVLASSRHVASMKLATTSACLADNSSSHGASTSYQRSSIKSVDAAVDNRQ